MEEKYKEVEKKLKKYNQEHLLIYYKQMNSEEKEQLLNQILNIDFEQILELYQKTKEPPTYTKSIVEPIPYVDKSKLTLEQTKEYETLGTEIIKKGAYAVVTMAGGQGTRLGHTAPKGTFEIGIGENKSLFQALSETIQEAQQQYKIQIPWYIMTSRENNKQTIQFFEQHNYFGIKKSNINFFIQGELPMIGQNGKILVDENGKVKEAADGHGGIFEAMRKSGVIQDMQTKKIEWVFIAGVDNILAKMVDPLLTGLAIHKKCLAAGKSVVKNNPQEKVGVFCKKDKKPNVIEYTEITQEMAQQKDTNGELTYGESHILCNLFNIKAIEEIAKNKLPYHSAFKKAKHINEKGELIQPTEPNAYKFEAFIFDAFNRLEDMAIMRVKREEEFAPVKNADGVDSPETAKQLYLNYVKNNKKN